jgi:hypothetical protein
VRVEQESGGNQESAEALVLRAAKTLQSSFARQTSGGEPRKWRDVPPDEKKVWLRLSRAAEKVFREPGSPPAAAEKPLASPAIASVQEKVLAPVPKPAPPVPAPAREPIAAKPPATASAATAKPASPQKMQGTSAMLRLLGLKPRDAV